MSVIKGVLIPADDQTPTTAVEFDSDNMENIQQYVGGYFQCVDIPSGSIWCNEDGRASGFSVNKRASLLLYTERPEFIGNDVLVGDVLVLGGTDSHGNTLGAPNHLIDRLVQS